MASAEVMREQLQGHGIEAESVIQQGHDMVIRFHQERDKEAFTTGL